MNTPNKLTILRILMAPVFLVFMLVEFNGHYLAALLVFILAAFTDLLDGQLARRNNQITDFGKFLDPLADKMLTTAAFLAFIQLHIGYGIVWITMIVLTREFLITSLRLVASGEGKVIAANIWGKIKTVSQMSAVILSILLHYLIEIRAIPQDGFEVVKIICTVCLWISAALGIISGLVYVIKNKKFINYKK